MPTPSILIDTSRNLHHVVSPVERDLAEAAEAVLRDLGADIPAVRFWVHASDVDMKARLKTYLQDLKTELVAEAQVSPQQA